MTSELKSATARANGAKSRGPKTEVTRAISARNSLKHGFTARNTIVLKCESAADYEEMTADFEAVYKPATPEQKNLVDEMAACRWRLDRFLVVETALIDDEMDRIGSLPGDPSDTGIRLARAIRSLADDSNALSLVRRYQSTLKRSFDKAYRTLRELQDKAKPSPPSAAPEAQPKSPNTDYETNPALSRGTDDRCVSSVETAPSTGAAGLAGGRKPGDEPPMKYTDLL